MALGIDIGLQNMTSWWSSPILQTFPKICFVPKISIFDVRIVDGAGACPVHDSSRRHWFLNTGNVKFRIVDGAGACPVHDSSRRHWFLNMLHEFGANSLKLKKKL
jgi:hypothetical protein